jgi:hypothetical protein
MRGALGLTLVADTCVRGIHIARLHLWIQRRPWVDGRRDLQQANLTQVWLAAGDDPKAIVTRRYYYRLKRREPDAQAQDVAWQNRLIRNVFGNLWFALSRLPLRRRNHRANQ